MSVDKHLSDFLNKNCHKLSLKTVNHAATKLMTDWVIRSLDKELSAHKKTGKYGKMPDEDIKQLIMVKFSLLSYTEYILVEDGERYN